MPEKIELKTNCMGNFTCEIADSVEKLRKYKFIARPMPERMEVAQHIIPEFTKLSSIPCKYIKFPNGDYGEAYYIPACKYGYTDCICDKESYRLTNPEKYAQALKEDANFRNCPYCNDIEHYDDECK